MVRATARRLGLTLSQYLKKLIFDNLYFEIEKERVEGARTGEEG
jgi:hypothetical protein